MSVPSGFTFALETERYAKTVTHWTPMHSKRQQEGVGHSIRDLVIMRPCNKFEDSVD